MGGPKAPTPPDPQVTAAAQTATNIGTAVANQAGNLVNQNTPQGSLSFEQTDTYRYTDPNSGDVHEIPRYTATQSLSPQQQAIFDQTQAAEQNLARLANDQSSQLYDHLGQPFDAASIAPPRADPRDIATPELQTQLAGNSARDRVEGALMGRLQPYIDRDRDRLDQRLANQGIKLGSGAHSEAYRDFDRNVADQRLAVIGAAGDEQQRQLQTDLANAEFGNASRQQGFGNALQMFGLQNQTRDAALNEAFAARNQPINEVSALLSSSQVDAPNFVSPPAFSAPTTDYAGIVSDNYNQRLNAWQARQASGGGFLGGLFSLGGRALGGLF
ncbi:MAG: tail fiber domain-containing protein [Pseudomonadota bacterium]